MHRLLAAAVVLGCALTACTYTEGGPQPRPTPTRPPAVGPALGTAGFSAAVYPKPVAADRATGVLPTCPARVGLRRPPPAFGSDAVAVVNRMFSKSRGWDLRHTDRTMWPEIVSRWRHDPSPEPGAVDRRDFPVLYSGPVTRTAGNPSPYEWIVRSCGARVLRASYLVLSGPPDGPSLQTDFVFVNRHGHALLYFVY